jgi:hypothetical protein
MFGLLALVFVLAVSIALVVLAVRSRRRAAAVTAPPPTPADELTTARNREGLLATERAQVVARIAQLEAEL